jgi:hypothetical protein
MIGVLFIFCYAGLVGKSGKNSQLILLIEAIFILSVLDFYLNEHENVNNDICRHFDYHPVSLCI